MGVREIVKRTCSSVHTEEVIDLTTDEPPDEFMMVIDLPSDEKDSETDVVKNEPENHYRDNDGYDDADGDDAAGYDVGEEYT